MTLKEQKAEADRKYFEHINTCPVCKTSPDCKIERQLEVERKELLDALIDLEYWNQGLS
jgi:hypothetical protein